MREKITLTIPTPCHEKWEKFTPTSKGGFCGSCQKEVIDFTSWSEDEIKQYFRSGPTSTCGRFRSNQLITYQPDPHVSHPSRWAAALAFLLLLITRPAEAQTSSAPVAQEMVEKRNQNAAAVDPITRLILRGVVTEADSGQVLPGVNVLRKGTVQGTVTDADGRFELVIDHPKAVETLVVSFIGLVTVEQEVSVTSASKEVNIALQNDVTGEFNSIVVVGGVVSYRWYSPRGLWWKVKGLFRR
ncbi:MAG: carboxypeptidase-like regulatory domain-containing protein [Bacteroidetes bacterium]|nr:carboxypeptidase-like regulatory domain-containing protein [Bacteroidota bacterium]